MTHFGKVLIQKKKRVIKGTIFVLIILSTIIYGFLNGTSPGKEGTDEEFSITTTTITRMLTTETTILPKTEIEKEDKSDVIESTGNKTNSSNSEPKDIKEKKDNRSFVLKYFWSKYCRTCVGEGPVIKKLLIEHPSIKLVRLDLEEEGGIAELKKYGLIGAPSYALVVDENTTILFRGPMSNRRIKKFKKIVCPIIKDETCHKERYI